jgi:hypothetical protein
LHENLDHIKAANDKLNKYYKCRMKDHEDEKENLVNKNQRLLKALEAITSIGIYLFFLFYIFLYSQTPN